MRACAANMAQRWMKLDELNLVVNFPVPLTQAYIYGWR